MNKYKKAEDVALKYLNEWIRDKSKRFPEVILSEYFNLYSSITPENEKDDLKTEAINSLCKRVDINSKRAIKDIKKKLYFLAQ